MSREEDLIYQVNTHLLYELRWLIAAAARYEESRPGDPYIALIDSATIHARNLFEFAWGTKKTEFNIRSLGGTAQPNKAWSEWANSRVTHMRQRELKKAQWPGGISNKDPDKLMVMAGSVLDTLETGGRSMPAGDIKSAYDTLISAARQYWRHPNDTKHEAAVEALHDDSRDDSAPDY